VWWQIGWALGGGGDDDDDDDDGVVTIGVTPLL